MKTRQKRDQTSGFNGFSRTRGPLGAICCAGLLLATPLLARGEGSPARRPHSSQSETVFRFHLPSEPSSLDPARLASSDASYFFNNVMRGLYRYDNERGLVAEGAESCRFETSLKLVCRLSRGAKWSDGRRVVAQDYSRAFEHLLSPQSKNAGIELLKNVKNALAFHSGSKPASELGIKAEKDDKLRIEFEKPDPDFIYKLATSLLVPIRQLEFPARELSGNVPVNGPYRVAQWLPGKRIRLEPNAHYARGNKRRPPVEVLFIDDDETALNLYESGTLTFLRRLPTQLIPKYKTREDFIQIPVARFDYVGFGTELKDQPELREALSLSADYRELQKIYDALGTPGCPGLPESFLDQPSCLKFDLARARAAWAKVPIDAKAKRYKFVFSKLGGDDLKRGAEWFQAQWKKNLGLTVDIEQVEQGVYLQTLRERPPAIFRKGVGLERPTCLAALETFARGGAENFLNLEDPKFESILERLANVSSATQKKTDPDPRRVCGEGVQFLLDRHLLVPLGRIHFTLLVKRNFKGWKLNEMNQLDLANLSTPGGP